MLCSPLLPSHPHPLEYSFPQVSSPHPFSTSLHTPICYCKPFLPFLTNTCYNPSLPTPSYQPTSFRLRSSSSNVGVFHLLHTLCLLPGPASPGGSGTFHASVGSSSSQSAAFLAVFLFAIHAPMATSMHWVPSWFQGLAYKVLLVADEEIQVQVAFTETPIADGTLKKKKKERYIQKKSPQMYNGPTNLSKLTLY